MVSGWDRGLVWAKHVKGVKRCKLSGVKQRNQGDRVYSTVTIVNDIVVHAWKLPREYLTKVLIFPNFVQ